MSGFSVPYGTIMFRLSVSYGVSCYLLVPTLSSCKLYCHHSYFACFIMMFIFIFKLSLHSLVQTSTNHDFQLISINKLVKTTVSGVNLKSLNNINKKAPCL